MSFPNSISLTITNVCNLRCRMCGQWSDEGYVRNAQEQLKQAGNLMTLTDWQRVADELAAHGIKSVLLRGGEPFLFPDIIQLIQYLHDKGMFVSIDSNGTQLKQYAGDLARIGQIHITVSVDGPEPIHDEVRGVKGCFARLRDGLAAVHEAQKALGRHVSTSITFTISPYSYCGLGQMPDVARSLGVKSICIVPYYYVPDALGREYERELRELGCAAFSWRGFHHEDSGIDLDEFRRQHKQFLATLDGVSSYPYMPLTEAEYVTWFSSATAPVGDWHCSNVERLIDIRPNGDANFCVDFPDYTIGNVKRASIEAIWNGEKAERFRQMRQARPLAVCHRCGAKHMSEQH
jgi:MoaA/NifB/PqqE/SkfB family radical SAM enzyme